MSYKKVNIWQTVDWLTILLYFVMVTAGWFSICGASYEYDGPGWFSNSGRPASQLAWIGLSFALIFIIMMLDADFFNVFAYFIYAFIIAVLVATIFLAPDIKGSHSWLVIGSLRIQPAEFAKFATALALAKLMSSYGFRLTRMRESLMVLMLIALPVICILLQKEMGSALVFVAFLFVLYREGMTGYVLTTGLCAVTFFVISMKYAGVTAGVTPVGELIVMSIIQAIVIILAHVIGRRNTLMTGILMGLTAGCALISYLISLFVDVNFAYVATGVILASCGYLAYLAVKQWLWRYMLVILFAVTSMGFLYSVDYVFDEMLKPHQQMRIKVALGLANDPSGAGYNVNQSKIAIGSGGLMGKGFLNGTQTKLKYVPEQDTDFIFCTVGEEEGFAGAAAILVVFAVFIIRLVNLAEKQKTTFARVYGYGVASVFFFHLVINIGMVTGITPVIGIPLPFFSYGGSSLWGFTILLFIFLRLDASSKER
ncbi:MAG: rod shape-determining protein RodA [Tannerellaceae bacterium]|jgi:rod shape determining protein RodA|nr:rod shape-determining protein RodA [Tannerellaceae bacterium]